MIKKNHVLIAKTGKFCFWFFFTEYRNWMFPNFFLIKISCPLGPLPKPSTVCTVKIQVHYQFDDFEDIETMLLVFVIVHGF